MTNEAFSPMSTVGDSRPHRDPIFAREWAKLGRLVELMTLPSEPGSLRELSRDAERLIVEAVWRSLGDNVSLVAGHLGITRKKVREMLALVRDPRPAPVGPQRAGTGGDYGQKRAGDSPSEGPSIRLHWGSRCSS